MGLIRGRKLLLSCLLWAIPTLSLAETVQVLMTTDKGNITLELYPDKAPATVANFLGYVRSNFYDGLIFHRVIKGFVIQSGGYTVDLVQKEPGAPVINEARNGLKNQRGTLAMARHADPDSATSQFFINLRHNDHLDKRPGYAVFGRVIEGMKVADAIGKTRVTEKEDLTDLPLKPVRILSIREIKAP
jgi:peptidyl-prolyl cis-trans isomerase A (cyclophilin A)